jgi:hypothetical protein
LAARFITILAGTAWVLSNHRRPAQAAAVQHPQPLCFRAWEWLN